MKLIISGHRDFHDWKVICHGMNEWQAYHKDKTITEEVCGNALGVDSLGALWARNHNIPVRLFDAEWDKSKQGKAAGPIRNQKMADYCTPKVDACIVFLRDFNAKSGSKDMYNRAIKRNLFVHVYNVRLMKIIEIFDPILNPPKAGQLDLFS